MTTTATPPEASHPEPEPSSGSLLDAGLIRRRRIALGLTERGFARQAGIGTVVIHNLELGTNHAELPVAVTAAVARVLGVGPSHLFRQTASPAVPERTDVGADGPLTDADVATAGALLAAACLRVPLTALAEVTGWTLEHTEDVIAQLSVDVAAVRQAVEQHIGHVGLAHSATAASRECLHDLTRNTLARTGMNLRHARTLHRVWAGTLTGAEHDNSTRVALGELVNAGLVDYSAGPRVDRPELGPGRRLACAAGLNSYLRPTRALHGAS